MTTTTGSRYFSEEFQQAEAKGLAKGEAQGVAKGLADAVLTLLQGRDIGVPDDARERILGCTDRDQLRSWLMRAATATTIDDVTTE